MIVNFGEQKYNEDGNTKYDDDDDEEFLRQRSEATYQDTQYQLQRLFNVE
jgi:hypothetical protein